MRWEPLALRAGRRARLQKKLAARTVIKSPPGPPCRSCGLIAEPPRSGASEAQAFLPSDQCENGARWLSRICLQDDQPPTAARRPVVPPSDRCSSMVQLLRVFLRGGGQENRSDRTIPSAHSDSPSLSGTRAREEGQFSLQHRPKFTILPLFSLRQGPHQTPPSTTRTAPPPMD